MCKRTDARDPACKYRDTYSMVLQVRFPHLLIVDVRTLLDNWIVLELRVNDWRGAPRVICLQCEEGEGKQSTVPEQDGIFRSL